MKKITVIVLSLLIASNSFAMSKPLKFIISSVLFLGGVYCVANGAQLESTELSTSNNSTSTTNSSSGSWGNGYTSNNTTVVTTNVSDTQSNTKLKDVNLTVIGLALIAGSAFTFLYIKSDEVGVQVKF